MAKPDPGTYYIINTANSYYTQQPLALTFDSQGINLVVADFVQGMPSQEWVVSNYVDGKTQSVSPLSSQSLQIAMGSGVLVTLPAYNYVWTIRTSDTNDTNVYTVQDGAQTVFWYLQEEPREAEFISFGSNPDANTQNWKFVPAT